MSGGMARRARIARVRRVQHLQAAARAAQAERKADALESTADHLAQLRLVLAPEPGALSGAQLANAAELAMRLDMVRDGLTDAIVAARATALDRAARRLEARIRQESAERLEERARHAVALLRERPAGVAHRRKGSGWR